MKIILWAIQEVRRNLNNKYSFAELVDLAKEHMDFPSTVDVDHDRFLDIRFIEFF